jgi:hypothetical protein
VFLRGFSDGSGGACHRWRSGDRDAAGFSTFSGEQPIDATIPEAPDHAGRRMNLATPGSGVRQPDDVGIIAQRQHDRQGHAGLDEVQPAMERLL